MKPFIQIGYRSMLSELKQRAKFQYQKFKASNINYFKASNISPQNASYEIQDHPMGPEPNLQMDGYDTPLDDYATHDSIPDFHSPQRSRDVRGSIDDFLEDDSDDFHEPDLDSEQVFEEDLEMVDFEEDEELDVLDRIVDELDRFDFDEDSFLDHVRFERDLHEQDLMQDGYYPDPRYQEPYPDDIDENLMY